MTKVVPSGLFKTTFIKYFCTDYKLGYRSYGNIREESPDNKGQRTG